MHTIDGERPIDLCESDDFATIGVMLRHQQNNNASKSDSKGSIDTDDEDSDTIPEHPEHD